MNKKSPSILERLEGFYIVFFKAVVYSKNFLNLKNSYLTEDPDAERNRLFSNHSSLRAGFTKCFIAVFRQIKSKNYERYLAKNME